MNHLNLSIRALPMQRLLPVRSLDEFEHLVKESEVLTGRAGRTFVIAGADWLAYRVHWHPIGLKVERLDAIRSHLYAHGFSSIQGLADFLHAPPHDLSPEERAEYTALLLDSSRKVSSRSSRRLALSCQTKS